MPASIRPRNRAGSSYALALLWFHLAGIAVLYALLRLQNLLPLNPQQMDAMTPDLALNTAVSFATNTSWQSYGGETTLSYLSQMAGIVVQSFMSAAVGVAVALALVRGFARRSAQSIGNFWVDLTRITFYVLLPICIVAALIMMWQGVPQTFSPYVTATTLEGAQQVIALGPVASQKVVAVLSGDGGGFFNVNSAHPFENPTALTGLIQMLLIFVIGVALTNTFGRMVGDQRHGWALFAVMAILFVVGLGVIYGSETQPNPAVAAVRRRPELRQHGRQGGALRRRPVVAVRHRNDSFLGRCGQFDARQLHAAVRPGDDGQHDAGRGHRRRPRLRPVRHPAVRHRRSVRRRPDDRPHPEYLGKKIEGNEVKMTMLALLCVPAAILGIAAVAAVLPAGVGALNNAGPHGFSELLYTYTSGAATNGSAFAGVSANSPFYNLTLAVAMFAGRFLVIVPVLCIAGTLAAKRLIPASTGTLPTHGMQFVGLLVGTIVIVGGLTFFPALALGPAAEHFAMQAGQTY